MLHKEEEQAFTVNINNVNCYESIYKTTRMYLPSSLSGRQKLWKRGCYERQWRHLRLRGRGPHRVTLSEDTNMTK